MNEYVRIFDTTLRDGEQSPGASLTSSEKLKLARALAKLGVDVIEAGFPAASPDDLAAVRRIAEQVGQSTNGLRIPIICGLARATKKDIDKAWEGVREAKHPRIHTFLATSDIHMKYKLNMSRDEVVKRVFEMTSYARSLCEDVEFSPEDGGRSDPEFLYIVLGEAIRGGASTINIPDTVGFTTPGEFGNLIDAIINNTPGIKNCIVSTHCHNDLGLATANTLAGVMAGARQVEVTMNGIGERAGNTSLEEVVMALHTRRPFFNLSTGIDTTQIMRLSKMVSNYTGIIVQPNKAIVGANAFAHEAGIHQDGMLKNQQTYEIMRPESVGVKQSQLVLGKHSGRHALKIHLETLGYTLEDSKLDKLFEDFKVIADKKKIITNADLEALVAEELYKQQEVYLLDGMQITCGTMGMPTASVRLIGPDGKKHVKSSIGTGPVDALYKAIDGIIHASNKLTEFSIHAVTEGIDAIGEVTVRIQNGEGTTVMHAMKDINTHRTFGGYGADTDILVACAKAYLAAINKMLVASGEFDSQLIEADQLNEKLLEP